MNKRSIITLTRIPHGRFSNANLEIDSSDMSETKVAIYGHRKIPLVAPGMLFNVYLILIWRGNRVIIVHSAGVVQLRFF